MDDGKLARGSRNPRPSGRGGCQKTNGGVKLYKGVKIFLKGDDVEEASIDALNWIEWNFGENYKLEESR